MVRLVRIESDDRNGLFDNNFSTDISVNENNQIALQSSSFSALFNVLEVDGVNSNIQFQYTNTLSVNANLSHKDQYDDSNKDDLFSDMTTQLNKGLVYQAGKTIGMEFLANIGASSDKAEIGYKRSNYHNNDTRVNTDGTSEYQNMQFTSNEFRKDDSTDSSADETKYYSFIPWGKGCHIHRLRITSFNDNLGSDDDNGLILGLSNVDPTTWKASPLMTEAQKTYYIQFDRADETYRVKTKGNTITDTGITPTKVDGVDVNNDIIEIVRSGSRIKAHLYRHNQGGVETLFDVEQTEGEELYPFVILRGGNGSCRFNKAGHTIDPFHTAHVNTGKEEEDYGARPNPPPAQVGGGGATLNKLTLKQTVADFIGFENLVNSLTAINGNFVADNIFEATSSNTSFIVELRNLEIDSFNSTISRDGERQNICAVIPTSNNTHKSIIEYEPNNLYYVDIKQNTNIRNLKCRILRIDGSKPVLTGLSVLTFLIR